MTGLLRSANSGLAKSFLLESGLELLFDDSTSDSSLEMTVRFRVFDFPELALLLLLLLRLKLLLGLRLRRGGEMELDRDVGLKKKHS